MIIRAITMTVFIGMLFMVASGIVQLAGHVGLIDLNYKAACDAG